MLYRNLPDTSTSPEQEAKPRRRIFAIAEEFQLKGLMRPMNYDEVDKEEILGKEIVRSF